MPIHNARTAEQNITVQHNNALQDWQKLFQLWLRQPAALIVASVDNLLHLGPYHLFLYRSLNIQLAGSPHSPLSAADYRSNYVPL